MNTYTAITKKVDDWWIGWIKEISGVNSQERTHKELIESLKDALKEMIEFNIQDAKKIAESDYKEETISI